VGVNVRLDAEKYIETPSCKCLAALHREVSRLTSYTLDGWFLHHTKGDHHQFKHPNTSGKVTVPHPQKNFPVDTLRNIFRQAGWEWR